LDQPVCQQQPDRNTGIQAPLPATGGAGRSEGHPRQVRCLQRSGVSAPLAADGGADSVIAIGCEHSAQADLSGSPPNVFLVLARYIARLDELICEQVNAILHAPAFQRLEAGWLGLKYLTEAADGTPLAKIRVLSVSWGEVVRDLDRASDFDRSHLFE